MPASQQNGKEGRYMQTQAHVSLADMGSDWGTKKEGKVTLVEAEGERESIL